MIRFSIFGIPVEVQPFFWVTTALLGGAIYARTRYEILAMLLFMIAAFISILIHELGHAITGRKLGGGAAKIELVAFGGLAYSIGGRFDRMGNFWRIFAGPGAGFAFLLVILAFLSMIFGVTDVWGFTQWTLFGVYPKFQIDSSLSEYLSNKTFVFILLRHLLWINFWWGVINLLPVMPLDGGQIANLLVTPQRRVHLIGLVTAAAMTGLAFFWLDSVYMGILFGFLAWKNYEAMQAAGWQ
jgi:Zn-dependent protease